MAAATSIITIATLHTTSLVSSVSTSSQALRASSSRRISAAAASVPSTGGCFSSAPGFWSGCSFADSMLSSSSSLSSSLSRIIVRVRVRVSSSSSSLRFGGSPLQAMVAPDVQGSCSRSSRSSGGGVVTESLPKKLQEIVKMFEAVPDPRSKCEQLLHYAKQLKPLGKEYLTPENKVQGCVSQVWVKPSVSSSSQEEDEEHKKKKKKRFYFEAESDSLLTKGLAALLVEGLSGSTAQEILAVTPDFIQALGLHQSLTPSRSNGFLNMLKLMQKKTLQLSMESEDAPPPSMSNSLISMGTSSVSSSAKDAAETDVRKDMIKLSPVIANSSSATSRQISTSSAGGGGEGVVTKKAIIEEKLEEALAPTKLEVEDVSYQHAGHSGVERGAMETHFNVKVVSESFEGRSLLKRHQLVYDVLKDELQTGSVHALSLITKTPREVAAAGKT